MLNTLSEYYKALISPLKYILLAYMLNAGGNKSAEEIAAIFGLDRVPENGTHAWSIYSQEQEKFTELVEENELRGVEYPFERFCRAFGFSWFERFALAFCVAWEIDPVYRELIKGISGKIDLDFLLCLYSSGSEECIELSLGLWQREEALGLIFNMDSEGVVSLNKTSRSFLFGARFLPKGCDIYYPASEKHDVLAGVDLLPRILRRLDYCKENNLFILRGPAGSGRKLLLKRLADYSNKAVIFVRRAYFQEDELWQKQLETALALASAYLCVCDEGLESSAGFLRDFLNSTKCENIFVSCGSKLDFERAKFNRVYIDFPVLGVEERLRLWNVCGKDYSGIDFKAFASQYGFTAGQIKEACASAGGLAAEDGDGCVDAFVLHRACNMQFPQSLTGIAPQITSSAKWEDIVLPLQQLFMLHHICNQVIYHDAVYEGKNIEYGKGVSAIFTGPPGTGKTMAAGIIAAELNMKLFKVNLASLVSKYIGETEKNLDDLFNRAEKSGGILFFDEADALFGKRGEQNSSNDKYANMQTAFLLQRFEDYKGVVILASNLASNLDPAFARRIGNKVDFPYPTAESRVKIWERLLLENKEISSADILFLGQSFEMTGASIKNAVIHSEFFAVAENRNVVIEDIIRAVVMEHDKSGKIISKENLGEYAYCLR